MKYSIYEVLISVIICISIYGYFIYQFYFKEKSNSFYFNRYLKNKKKKRGMI